MSILVNDTVRVTVTFRDWNTEGHGTPIDPQSVIVNVWTSEATPALLITDTPIRADVGEYYYDWTPTEVGLFDVEFIGTFADSSTSTIRDTFEVEVSHSATVTLLEPQELLFATDAPPLYVDPDELLVHYPDAGSVEIMELINRYSSEVALLFKGKTLPADLPFVAFEYIRAAALCGLSKVYDYGMHGDENSLTLGDLAISSQTYPRKTITRANAVNWCELAAALRTEMMRTKALMKGVRRGSAHKNPMPERDFKRFN